MVRYVLPEMRFIGLATVMITFTASVQGQVIYEPVQYQYGSGQDVYYYGGSNPKVIAYANAQRGYNRPVSVAREIPVVLRQQVYSDRAGYRDAAQYGYTPGDALNEANTNAVRYFRKSEVIRMIVEGPAIPAPVDPAPQVKNSAVPVQTVLVQTVPVGIIKIIPVKHQNSQKNGAPVVLAK